MFGHLVGVCCSPDPSKPGLPLLAASLASVLNGDGGGIYIREPKSLPCCRSSLFMHEGLDSFPSAARGIWTLVSHCFPVWACQDVTSVGSLTKDCVHLVLLTKRLQLLARLLMSCLAVCLVSTVV